MTLVCLGFASALYLFAAFVGFTGRELGLGRWGIPLVLGLAVLLHGAGFYGLHLQQPPVSLSSFPAALALIGWGVALSWLVLHAWRPGLRSTGPWIAIWSHAHVLLGTAGFSLLALASFAGLGYLAKERGLKQRRSWHHGLPALESLDQAEHVTLALGFALLTLGVATGFAWSVSQGLDPWNRHTLFLSAAWAVYLVPVGARVLRQQRGPWPARGVVLGFLFLVCSYVGIHVIGAGS